MVNINNALFAFSVRVIFAVSCAGANSARSLLPYGLPQKEARGFKACKVLIELIPAALSNVRSIFIGHLE